MSFLHQLCLFFFFFLIYFLFIFFVDETCILFNVQTNTESYFWLNLIYVLKISLEIIVDVSRYFSGFWASTVILSRKNCFPHGELNQWHNYNAINFLWAHFSRKDINKHEKITKSLEKLRLRGRKLRKTEKEKKKKNRLENMLVAWSIKVMIHAEILSYFDLQGNHFVFTHINK